MLRTEILVSAEYVDDIVEIHMKTFTGFFLTFLGRGFLKHLYKGFIEHDKSNVIGAFEDDRLVGFLAYSEDISAFYKYLIRKRLLPFAFYGALAFFRKPAIMLRLLRAFTYPESSKRPEPYVELSSIGVLPEAKNKGIGTMLIDELKKTVSNGQFSYIKLETDRLNNDAVNAFYIKNGFVLDRSYTTREGREMNEYHFKLTRNETSQSAKGGDQS